MLPFDHRTTTRVYLRSERRVARWTAVALLETGTLVHVVPSVVYQDGAYNWRIAVTQGGKVGWIDGTYLKPIRDESPAPPPNRNTFGLHYYPDNPDLNQMLAMADEGLLTGVTVVNDVNVANEFAKRNVPYVVYRAGVTNSDPHPPIKGDESDIEVGYNWFYRTSLWAMNAQADPRIILQLTNENKFPDALPFYDNFFYIGALRAADEQKRRLVIFNDAVGNPHMWRDGTGNWQSLVWQKRTGALRACLYESNGKPRLEKERHFVGYHAYSRPGGKLASDPEDWIWYGGRWSALYETVEAYQPPLLLTEYGSFEADVALMPDGHGGVVTDIARSLPLLAAYPQVKAFMYWTVGGGKTGWEKSRIDPALPAIADVVRAYKRNQ